MVLAIEERRICITRSGEALLDGVEKLPDDLLRVRTAYVLYSQPRFRNETGYTLTKGDWNLFRRVARADDERRFVEAQIWDELLQMELGGALRAYLASVVEHI